MDNNIGNEVLKPCYANNFLIESLREANSILKFLGLEYCSDFNASIRRIHEKQWELNEKYGIKIEILKTLFNLRLPLKKRIAALGAIKTVLEN